MGALVSEEMKRALRDLKTMTVDEAAKKHGVSRSGLYAAKNRGSGNAPTPATKKKTK